MRIVLNKSYWTSNTHSREGIRVRLSPLYSLPRDEREKIIQNGVEGRTGVTTRAVRRFVYFESPQAKNGEVNLGAMETLLENIFAKQNNDIKDLLANAILKGAETTAEAVQVVEGGGEKNLQMHYVPFGCEGYCIHFVTGPCSDRPYNQLVHLIISRKDNLAFSEAEKALIENYTVRAICNFQGIEEKTMPVKFSDVKG